MRNSTGITLLSKKDSARMHSWISQAVLFNKSNSTLLIFLKKYGKYWKMPTTRIMLWTLFPISKTNNEMGSMIMITNHLDYRLDMHMRSSELLNTITSNWSISEVNNLWGSWNKSNKSPLEYSITYFSFCFILDIWEKFSWDGEWSNKSS